jgi:protoporphyrinogen/coproporphyrinogen III oxidase
MAIAMNRTALVSRVLVLVTILTAGLGAGCITEGEAELAPDDPSLDLDDTEVSDEARARQNPRIAIIGAGPSGLTAALTLKDSGYTNVTVFEKENRVGGKVHTLNSNGLAAELGAVFASPDYREVLRLAQRFSIPYAEYTVPRYVLNEQGVKQTSMEFLTTRYSLAEIQAAVIAYQRVLTDYAFVDTTDGFAGFPSELKTTKFSDFAAAKGITPIAELAKSIIVGFGYSYYEEMPAMYGMKILPWLIKVGPSGLVQPTYYTFPTGFQSLWTAVASQVTVRLSSPVYRIDRVGSGSFLSIDVGADGSRANDGPPQYFDKVIVTIPLNLVTTRMIPLLTSRERDLFARVDTDRYFVSLFTSPNLTRGETVFVHDNARPGQINHINAWGNRDPASSVYIGYQLVDDTITAANVVATLAADIANLGRATFGSVVFQKEWPDYFPSISRSRSNLSFFEDIEDLQGDYSGTYYLGGTVAFETVEHTTRYAKARVSRWFPVRN